MKIQTILNLLVVLAVLFLSSFTDKKEDVTRLNASLDPVENTFKVKLTVDSAMQSPLRITLKGKNRKIYYSEVYRSKDQRYIRIFNMNEMDPGIYYFELSYKKQRVTKEVEIQRRYEKLITLL